MQASRRGAAGPTAEPLPQRVQRPVAKATVHRQALRPDVNKTADTTPTAMNTSQSTANNGIATKKVCKKALAKRAAALATKMEAQNKVAVTPSIKVAQTPKVTPGAKVAAQKPTTPAKVNPAKVATNNAIAAGKATPTKAGPTVKVATNNASKVTPAKLAPNTKVGPNNAIAASKATPAKVAPTAEVAPTSKLETNNAIAASKVTADAIKVDSTKSDEVEKTVDVENAGDSIKAESTGCGLPLTEALAVEEEVCRIMEVMWNSLPDKSASEAESLVVRRLKNDISDDISEVFAMTLAARLLDVHNSFYAKVSFTPAPTAAQLGAFSRSLRVWKRRAVGGGRYALQLRRWRDLDRVCALRDYDGLKVEATPVYDFTTYPKELTGAGGTKREAKDDNSSIASDTTQDSSKPENNDAKKKENTVDSPMVVENNNLDSVESIKVEKKDVNVDVNINDLLHEGIVLDECVGSDVES